MGRRSLTFVASPPEYLATAHFNMRDKFLNQPGFADSGLADDGRHATVRSDCVLESRLQYLEFTMTADKGIS